MMKKLIHKILILFFFACAINQIKIPPHNLENWKILNDGMPWIGCQEYNGFPWCREIGSASCRERVCIYV